MSEISETNAPSREPAADRRAPRTANHVRRAALGLLARLHQWAESGWAGSATATWGVLQGSVVPGPADALLVPLGLADPPRAPRLAAWACAGAIVGGIAIYLVGRDAFDALGRPLLDLFGVGPERLAASRALFEQRGWMMVLLGAVSPISTKAMCLGAGAFGVPFAPFVAALGAGRIVRFAVVGLVLRLAGDRMDAILRRRLGRGIERLG